MSHVPIILINAFPPNCPIILPYIFLHLMTTARKCLAAYLHVLNSDSHIPAQLRGVAQFVAYFLDHLDQRVARNLAQVQGFWAGHLGMLVSKGVEELVEPIAGFCTRQWWPCGW